MALCAAVVSHATSVKDVSRRLDSLASEVTFLSKVLERKGIDLERERRALRLADSTFVMPVGKAPTLGEANAPLVIDAFLDVQCPYCVRALPALRQIQAEYPKTILLVFRHFPLSMHPQAEVGHRAMWAAQQQGKFWEYLAELEANPRDMSDSALNKIATGLGLDVARFGKDRESNDARVAVGQELLLGNSVGVQGTPSLYLNGKQIQGLDVVDRLAKELQAKP
jgi:protein-disulfide isomerase